MGASDFCNDIIPSTAYVYTTAAVPLERIVRQLAIAEISIEDNDTECLNLVRKVVCNFFFPSCGSQSGVHRPVSVCSAECTFVAERCATTWESAQEALRLMISEDEPALGDIDCMNTASRVGNVSGCCSDVNVTIPGMFAMPTTPATPTVCAILTTPHHLILTHTSIDHLAAPDIPQITTCDILH